MINSFCGISATQRLSFYADDVAMFIKPTTQDLNCVREVLGEFGEASGLRMNYRKSATILIRGDEADRERVVGLLHYELGNFPCRYLGIQLAIKQMTRVDWHPILDQVRKIIPAWQRGLIQRLGRLILVKSVISAWPIHHLLVLDAPVWVFEEIDKCM